MDSLLQNSVKRVNDTGRQTYPKCYVIIGILKRDEYGY